MITVGLALSAFAAEDSRGGKTGQSTKNEQQENDQQKNDQQEDDQQEDDQADEIIVTQHRLAVGGVDLSYTARVGKMAVRDDQGKMQGHIFFSAYELDGQEGDQRPVTFAFNGGPGAGSVWLHMGGLGPMRVSLEGPGRTPPPPTGYRANEHTWLRFTDLVFVDPIGTGFSRSSLGPKKTKSQFYGVKQDIEYLAGFIHDYLNQYNLWLRPLFIAGESYGTTRAAGLPVKLNEAYGIRLNGLIMISAILDFNTIMNQDLNDLPYLLFLPTYAAAAHFHSQLPEGKQRLPMQQFLEETEKFCLNKYSSLLVKGDSLTEAEKEFLTGQLSSRTGLPPEVIERYRYRLPSRVILKHLLQDSGLLIGRMDTRITGIDPQPNSPYPVYDPSLEPYFAPFTMAFNAYLANELGYSSTLNYEFLNHEISRAWDWGSGLGHGGGQGQGYVSVSESLQEAMAINSHLHVFLAAGIYDLSTPYFSARYTLNHLFIPDSGKRITMETYPAGHMIYMNKQGLQALYADAERFYTQVMAIGR